MRKLLIYVFCLILIFPCLQSSREAPEKDDLVQLTGRLLNELLQPLPFAHILVLNNYRGTITDKEGKFSFVTQVDDSILFSCLGYKKHILIIPDTLSNAYLTLDLILQQDTFMIAEVEIYPWKDYEEFKKAFLNLDLPDTDMDNARRNIALLKTQIILDETPNSRENFQQILNEQYRQTFNQGTYPTYQVFNVFAWAEFFKSLKRGDFNKYSDPE